MIRRTSKYPVSQLISEILHKSGPKPSEFIRSIGYRNVNGGFRALDQWLQTGSGDPNFVGRLVRVYGHAQELQNALTETGRMKRREAELAAIERERKERADFKPYIFVESSLQTPTFITAAALVGCRMKFIRLPDQCLELSDTDQLLEVQDIVRRHYLENSGQCPLFGDITGYRFIQTYDMSIRLDIHGSVIARESGHFRIPLAVSARIGRISK